MEVAPRQDASHDRTNVLICGALLEQSLEEAIASHFQDIPEAERNQLFLPSGDRDAPVSSFYAKCVLAYSLGVFGRRTYSDFNKLRIIRNIFAHSTLPVSFDTPEIAAACGFGLIDTAPWGDDDLIGQKPQTPSEKFLAVSILFITYLTHPGWIPVRYKSHILSEFFA